MTTRPSTFQKLGVCKKKNVEAPRAPIFNRFGDRGSHVNIGSNIGTKKTKSTSHALVWCRIKHKMSTIFMVRSFLTKQREREREREIHSNVPSRMKRKTCVTLNTCQGSLKVKKHNVILTNPEKESSEQGEDETSCHHITLRNKKMKL